MRWLRQNPRVGVLVIAILGIIIHGIVLGWGTYANKIIYIMICAAIACVFYVYLFLPLGTRQHYAYIPFLIFAILLLIGLLAHIGLLIYAIIQSPSFWKKLLVQMFDGVVKTRIDFNVVNYCYIAAVVILFVFNAFAFFTVLIAFKYEANRGTQKLTLPTVSDFGTMPYSNLDVNGPGGEQLWTVKL